jgi:hypothetical protein
MTIYHDFYDIKEGDLFYITIGPYLHRSTYIVNHISETIRLCQKYDVANYKVLEGSEANIIFSSQPNLTGYILGDTFEALESYKCKLYIEMKQELDKLTNNFYDSFGSKKNFIELMEQYPEARI